MIAATELRIGNWVSDIHASDKSMWPVKALYPTVCKYGSFSARYEHLQPIPLTAEVLEKCGFSNCSCGGFKHAGLHIGKKDSGKLYYRGAALVYLHQLQNLYFALTGTELEIKL